MTDGASTFKRMAEVLTDQMALGEIDDYYFDETVQYGLERSSVIGLIMLASAQKYGVDLSQSVRNYERAVTASTARPPGYPDLQLLALLGACMVHIQERNLSTAEEILFKTCPPLLSQIDDLATRCFHQLTCARLLSTQGKHQEALDQANGALTALKKKQVDSIEVSLLAELYALLGQVYFRMGQHSQAMENYRASLVLADGIAFDMAKARALRGMGVIHSINRNNVLAIRCLKQSLDIYESLDYGMGVVQDCISLGLTYLSTSDIRDSRYYLEKARTWAERMGLLKEQAEIYSRLGHVHAAVGDYEVARDHFARDLEIISTTEDRRAIASACRNMGWINRKLGNHAESEAMFRQASTLFRSVEDRFNEAVTTLRLGETLTDAQRGDEASELLLSARHTFLALGKSYQVAVTDVAMGGVYRVRKEYSLAQNTLEDAIRVLKDKEPGFDLINAYYQLALVHLAMEEKDVAIHYLKETIGTARHLRNYEMEKVSTEALAREDPMEWLKMMNAPLLGAVTDDLRTERVRVAVLFGDIRGYTTMTGTHEVELIAELVNEYCDEMSKIVYRYNGFVNKLLGDAVMAIFGLGQEFDQLDSLRAALEMQEAIARINMRNRLRLGTEIQMGIGIATGEAVAGFFGSPQRREFTVIGSTVNLASRLQAVASGGDIIICSATYEAVKEKIMPGRCLEVQCKGFEQPQRVWEVTGLKLSADDPLLGSLPADLPNVRGPEPESPATDRLVDPRKTPVTETVVLDAPQRNDQADAEFTVPYSW